MKTSLRTVPALLLLLTLGCITSPIPVTPEQIASADYGTVPVPPAYQDAIKGYMQEILFDPRTARYRFVGEPQRGYAYLLGRRKPPVFGYLVQVEIDAKNLKGRYTGERSYRFFIKDETLYPLDTSTKTEVVQ
ncbi:MAG TPA: hypothetical protein VN647_04080 [Nitrospira sp.]|nr:hypothetical protein [Nitrospira sp.]